MTPLTLKQFRYFEALAQSGHFGRAAEACSISQPALSLQIKDLEETLGTPLFERGARQVRLTPFGEAFAERVRAILGSVDDLEDLARSARQEPLARLRLGVIPTVAPYFLPRILGDLSQKHPGLDVHLRETITPKLVQELNAGRLDAAIVALPVSELSFEEAPLLQEDFVLVRPLADADKPAPDADALRTMRLLLLEEGHCFRDQALSFCQTNSALPREMLEGSTLATLVQMVGAGIGVTLIPEMAVPVETRSASVSIVRFLHTKPARRIGMIWRKTSPLGPRFRALAATLRASAEAARYERIGQSV
jgi:LysR family hydrogen peroxide-inducible transcriptional activator